MLISSSSNSKLLGGTGGAKGGKESTKKHEETCDSGHVLYLDCGDSLMSAVFVKT